MAKRKPKTLSQLKKELWKHFALYIKLKYSFDGRFVKCYTCSNKLEIGTSNCQAGHWLPKGGYSYHYFNEDNVRPQCYHCNINLSGNTAVFDRNLKIEIGSERVECLFNSRHKLEKRDRVWYQQRIHQYKELNKSYDF